MQTYLRLRAARVTGTNTTAGILIVDVRISTSLLIIFCMNSPVYYTLIIPLFCLNTIVIII